MKNRIILAVIVCGALNFLQPGPLIAEETPAQKTENSKFSLRLKGATLSTLFDVLASKTGASFIAGPDISNMKVTVFIKQGNLEETIKLVENIKGLEFKRLGNTDKFIVKKAQPGTMPHEFLPSYPRDLSDPVLNKKVQIRLKGVGMASFLDIVSSQIKVIFILIEPVEDMRVTVFMQDMTLSDVLLYLISQGLSISRPKEDLFVIRKAVGPSRKFSEAESKFGEEKYEEAIKLYLELADKYPGSEMADYALLMTAVNYDWIAARDNEPAAIKQEEEILNRLIRNYPKSARLGDAYLYLGQIYSGHGGMKSEPVDCKKAIDLYELAIKNTYRDWVKAQAGVRIAQCQERSGEKEKARQLYAEIVKKYPDTEMAKEVKELLKEPDTLLQTGMNLEKQKEYALAIAVYTRIVEKDPSAQAAREAEQHIRACRDALGETKR